MCVQQLWSEEGIIQYRNKLKRKDVVATGHINEMVEKLNLSENKAIEAHSYYRRERRNKWFDRECK